MFLVWTDRTSCPSLANIVSLAYHQRMKFTCWYTCPTTNNTHSGSYCENCSTLQHCTHTS